MGVVWRREQAYFASAGGHVVRKGSGDFAGFWLRLSPRTGPARSGVAMRTPLGWMSSHLVVSFHKTLKQAQLGHGAVQPWKARGKTRHSLLNEHGKQLVVRVPLSRVKHGLARGSGRRYAHRMFRNGAYVGTHFALVDAKTQLERPVPNPVLIESPKPTAPRTTRGRSPKKAG